jgi:hypothetical protein
MNNAILASMELSDTYLVNTNVNTNTAKPAKTPKGVKNRNTPVVVATAFPPLTLAKTENM